jgi:hypothetical protein
MAYTAVLDTTNSILGADIDEIKDFLGVTGTDENNLITDLVNEVSWTFNRDCNRLFLQRALTEYYDGELQYNLWLRNPPVEGLTLYEDYEREFAADTEIDDDDYVLEAESGRVTMLYSRLARGAGIIKATYTGGYEDMPFDLRMAAKLRAARLYLLGKSLAWGTTSRSDDQGGQTGYMHEASPTELEAVRKYRLYRGMA